jgi:hypothetical protein
MHRTENINNIQRNIETIKSNSKEDDIKVQAGKYVFTSLHYSAGKYQNYR